MEQLHAKKVCIHARSAIHAHRRKRCKTCGKTWTIRKRRRGRKRIRANAQIATRYVQGKTVLPAFKHLRRSRDAFLKKTSWPSIPRGPSILIVDALHLRTQTYTAIIHLMLIKPLVEERAYILPPFIHPRFENKRTWISALEKIPQETLGHALALICDGKAGLPRLGKEMGWLVQRCRFHLMARLQMKRSRWILSRHRREGVFLYELFKTVCTTRSPEKLEYSLKVLVDKAREESNLLLKTIISGLVKNHHDYRTYLEHPSLNLPVTTNAVECLNSIIRRFLHRARGFRTAKSAITWIEVLLKHRRFIRVKTHRI